MNTICQQDADGELPSSVPGALLAVADKLDTFLSFTAAGMLPTGSNDPYALRRQVMGLVQSFQPLSGTSKLKTLLNYY